MGQRLKFVLCINEKKQWTRKPEKPEKLISQETRKPEKLVNQKTIETNNPISLKTWVQSRIMFQCAFCIKPKNQWTTDLHLQKVLLRGKLTLPKRLSSSSPSFFSFLITFDFHSWLYMQQRKESSSANWPN